MPAATQARPPAITSAGGLRLLLFGMPGSGKSSLLAALAQAAGAQASVLKGKLADDSGRLDALRQAAYAGTPSPTTEEVIAYPVHFVPQGPGEPAIIATLLDCDGRLAQQYLTGKRPLDPRDSALARAMLEADTVILTLDAAAPGNQVEAELATLRKFLALLRQVRGRRSDVADLPVYLVLTKCDQLARPDDTFTKWMQRIEEVKRRLGDRFAEFLARGGKRSFGTIELNLWATAARRPPLSDRPAQDTEPYQVAELFRQCLASAEGFNRREHRSGRQLELAVAGLGFLVAMLALLAALFAATQPDTELTRLQEQVQAVLPDPDAPADKRLRAPLKERLEQLEAVQKDANFPKLPAPTRDAVQQTAEEMRAYLGASQEFKGTVKQPYQAKDEAEFDRFEKQAKAFALPVGYAEAWTETSLARRLRETLRQYAAVHAAVAEEVRWIRERIDEGKQLYKQGNQLVPELTDVDPATQKQGRQQAQTWFAAYFKYINQPYFRQPGDQPLPGVPSMTYSDLRKFGAVREARQEWDDAKGQLDKTYKYLAAITGK
jgi:hypothetical protein